MATKQRQAHLLRTALHRALSRGAAGTLVSDKGQDCADQRGCLCLWSPAGCGPRGPDPARTFHETLAPGKALWLQSSSAPAPTPALVSNTGYDSFQIKQLCGPLTGPPGQENHTVGATSWGDFTGPESQGTGREGQLTPSLTMNVTSVTGNTESRATKVRPKPPKGLRRKLMAGYEKLHPRTRTDPSTPPAGAAEPRERSKFTGKGTLPSTGAGCGFSATRDAWGADRRGPLESDGLSPDAYRHRTTPSAFGCG